MVFFEAIGGLKYEEQTSAVLHYLFINSDTFRRSFVELISNRLKSSTMIPTFNNGVTCHLEVGRPGDKDAGRLDILLEADNCFLAIENKIWAALQQGQPEKYAPIAKDFSARKFYGDDSRYLLLVIAPEVRVSEIKVHVANQREDIIVISWSEIQQLLRELKGQSSMRVQVIGELLSEFIDHQTGKHITLNIAREKLVGPNANVTNPFQREFLYLIKSSFSDYNPSRMGFGKGTHAGFSFYLDGHRRGFFGFHQQWHVQDGTDLQFQVYMDHPPRELATWELIKTEYDKYFVYQFDPSEENWPTNRMEWQDAIESVIERAIEATDFSQFENERSEDEGETESS